MAQYLFAVYYADRKPSAEDWRASTEDSETQGRVALNEPTRPRR